MTNDLRIADAPLLVDVSGEEKLPTGGYGNYSTTINQIADFTQLKWKLATEGYVNNEISVVTNKLNTHTQDKTNPHGVTKEQVGLGEVDNTADLDKPVSAYQQSAIDEKIAKTSIVDNLTTDESAKVLSAKQGKTLQDTKANKVDVYTKDESLVLVREDKYVITESGRTQREKNKDYIHASDVGIFANNTDIDNSIAFVDALKKLNGKTLVLESGATYYIQNEIVSTGVNVSIKSNGLPATIKNTVKNARAMTLQGTEIGSALVTESITAFSRHVTLNDTSMIKVGDLIGLMSDKFWYCDARDETYKSQLNKVERIEGNTVYVLTAWSESYNIESEVLTAHIYRPITVLMLNVDLECTPMDVTPTASPSARGLTLSYTTNSVVTNTSTLYAQACGIQVGRSYNTLVVGGVSDKCNAYTSGYGVQTNGSAHTRITKRTITGGRRGVDISGIGIISTHTVVDDCTVIGGGVNSRGTVYGWNANGSTGAYQGGIGTHGASNYAEIRDNYIVNVHQPIILRSLNNIVEGNTCVGRTVRGAINIAFGGGNIIKNNNIIQGFVTNIDHTLSVYDTGANINTRRAVNFVTVQGTCIGEQIIENNYAEVQEVAIDLMGDTASTNIVRVINNQVVHKTASGSSECFLVSSSDNTANLSMLNTSCLTNNTQRRIGGSGAINIIPSNWKVFNLPMYGKLEGALGSSASTTITGVTNTTLHSIGALQTSKVGSIVNGSIIVICTPTTLGTTTVDFTVPYVGTFSSSGWCIGTAVSESLSTFGIVQSVANSNSVRLTFNAAKIESHRMQLNFQYQTRN